MQDGHRFSLDARDAWVGHLRDALTSDWYLFSDAEKEPYRERAVKVCAEAGDFLMWDSRTFHCNTVQARRDAVRACVYVCMLPSERVDARARAKRLVAWKERRTSNHHPADGLKLFPRLPRFVANGRDDFLKETLALQECFELTPLQKSPLCVPSKL